MTAADIRNAIKNTNLQYLWGQEGVEFTTTKETRATTHGSDLKGDFIRCLVGSTTLTEGTKGLLFTSEKIKYSKYVWVNDEQRPARGADIIKTGAYYTFCTLVTLPSGNTVVADCFKSIDHEGRIIGKVE